MFQIMLGVCLLVSILIYGPSLIGLLVASSVEYFPSVQWTNVVILMSLDVEPVSLDL